VKDRKTSLAPDIQKLRGLRHRMSEIEAIHGEKKKQYDNVVDKLDNEKDRMDSELK
jgi:hypothetical protein